MTKTKVLFLCTGNSARSQMAEGLLRKHAADRFEVHSAGVHPSTINPFTVQVMEEIGISMKDARAKSVMEYMGKVHFGYLITVCSRAEAECPTFPGMGQRLHWPFEDLAAATGSDEEKLAIFRRVRDQIEAQIINWLAEVA
ncbi:MAG: arsenate reductase ArsC [Chloroflexota bacterium]